MGRWWGGCWLKLRCVCVCAGLGVSLKGELCFWTRISQSRFLVCWFKPAPCVEPEVEIVSLSFPLHVWTNQWMNGWLNVATCTMVHLFISTS